MSRARSRPAWPGCRSRIPPATRRSRYTIARLAVERIKAARAAIDADSSGVLLTGRCEGFLVGQDDLNMVIDRLSAYSEAGADCLYAPGIKTREQITADRESGAPKAGQSPDRRVRS